ncbi:MAG: hypothetical protein CMD26_01180 [Flavobacteriales bacterium]|nr:hypothetical protein [Flavobacteriales bacterium]|tara:strand:- start:2747 stop:3847 length:1101 start_codon:yes stop_codon:yes gene_type:complete
MKHFYFFIFFFVLFSCDSNKINSRSKKINTSSDKVLLYDGETNLKNIKQLTFTGDNAEAYWSFDDSKLVFQVKNSDWDLDCDQIFITDTNNYNMNIEIPDMISTGFGRTTCSYFLPGDTTILYASTHLSDSLCPSPPKKREDGKYVWPIYETFDIFISDLNGNIVNQLTNHAGYDAEATVSPNGDKIVFTSMRSGDLELYTCDIDGGNVFQVTSQLGYDGGAFFSNDGKKLVFRASRPSTEEEVLEYKTLLSQGLVKPTNMELYTCNIDGSELKQITFLGGANWAPFYHPSDKKIIFSSNHKSTRGFPFNLYMIDINGENLKQITYDAMFDSFPVFSNDGTKIVFSSNRNNGGTRNTNLFIADWSE